MQFFIKMIFLGAVGGIIGWFTNYVAVKMLFRPLKPIKIFDFEIQGLIPKRKSDIAKSVGEIVENELISINDLWDSLINEKNKELVLSNLKFKVKKVTDENMPSFVPRSIKSMIAAYIGDIIDREFVKFTEQSSALLIQDISRNVNISQIVEEKINSFELEKLEKIVIQIAHKELYMIEVLGGVLGFVIGILQAFVIQFL